VGKEPSGQPFNSLVQLELEQGKPRNPFINAGALVICDLLETRLTAPRQRMLEIIRQLSQQSDIQYDRHVARSEYEHSARNAAIAWLMKSFGNFDNDVTSVMQTYFHYCSLSMNCIELARSFIYLANQGKTLDGASLISSRQARQINALMITSGMYDALDNFGAVFEVLTQVFFRHIQQFNFDVLTKIGFVDKGFHAAPQAFYCLKVLVMHNGIKLTTNLVIQRRDVMVNQMLVEFFNF